MTTTTKPCLLFYAYNVLIYIGISLMMLGTLLVIGRPAPSQDQVFLCMVGALVVLLGCIGDTVEERNLKMRGEKIC